MGQFSHSAWTYFTLNVKICAIIICSNMIKTRVFVKQNELLLLKSGVWYLIEIKSSFFFYILMWKQSVRQTDTITNSYGSNKKLPVRTVNPTVFTMSVLQHISVSDQSVCRPKLYRYSKTVYRKLQIVDTSIYRSTMTALVIFLPSCSHLYSLTNTDSVNSTWLYMCFSLPSNQTLYHAEVTHTVEVTMFWD